MFGQAPKVLRNDTITQRCARPLSKNNATANNQIPSQLRANPHPHNPTLSRPNETHHSWWQRQQSASERCSVRSHNLVAPCALGGEQLSAVSGVAASGESSDMLPTVGLLKGCVLQHCVCVLTGTAALASLRHNSRPSTGEERCSWCATKLGGGLLGKALWRAVSARRVGVCGEFARKVVESFITALGGD
eukprot:3283259-Rhodomonas_salina.1